MNRCTYVTVRLREPGYAVIDLWRVRVRADEKEREGNR